MSIKTAVLRARIRLFYEKSRKEALKLAFAVVITEVVMVGGLYFSVKWGIYELLQPKTVIITVAHAQATTPEDPKVSHPDNSGINDIMDTIWQLESGKGKNNYSKCQSIGKINGIGWNITGSGKYQCFNNHDQEMEVLKGWITDKQSQGMSTIQMLCLYSGNNYVGCK